VWLISIGCGGGGGGEVWVVVLVSVGVLRLMCGAGEKFISSQFFPGEGDLVGVVVVSRIRLPGVPGDLKISRLVRLVLFPVARGGGFAVVVVVVDVCGGGGGGGVVGFGR
jgi:hypothetical protein